MSEIDASAIEKSTVRANRYENRRVAMLGDADRSVVLRCVRFRHVAPLDGAIASRVRSLRPGKFS